jgi:hypothetical protein
MAFDVMSCLAPYWAGTPSLYIFLLTPALYVFECEHICRAGYICGVGRIRAEKSAMRELWTDELTNTPPKNVTGTPKAQQIYMEKRSQVT